MHKSSGVCGTCRAACDHKPGWFKPGEAEAVAQYLNVPLADLFKDKLAVDWWVGDGYDGGDIFVLSPVVVGETAGKEFPGDPVGKCVFFQQGRCSIHPVKPYECAQAVPCRGSKQPNFHQKAADSWNTETGQSQIRELLGREPETSDFSGGIFGMFGF